MNQAIESPQEKGYEVARRIVNEKLELARQQTTLRQGLDYCDQADAEVSRFTDTLNLQQVAEYQQKRMGLWLDIGAVRAELRCNRGFVKN